jgi:hypothetical protein
MLSGARGRPQTRQSKSTELPHFLACGALRGDPRSEAMAKRTTALAAVEALDVVESSAAHADLDASASSADSVTLTGILQLRSDGCSATKASWREWREVRSERASSAQPRKEKPAARSGANTRAIGGPKGISRARPVRGDPRS